jgi:hypothetical protein
MIEMIAAVAGLLGLSAKECSQQYRAWRERRQSLSAQSLAESIARVANQGLARRVVRRVYPRDELLREGLAPVTVAVGDERISTAMVSRPDWQGLSIALTDTSQLCELVSAPLVTPSLPKDTVFRFVEQFELLKLDWWDQSIYRLHAWSHKPDSLAASFSEDRYKNYRQTTGLMQDELVHALIDADFHPNAVDIQGLTLRNTIMPSCRQIESLTSRICMGGVAVMFAAARGTPHHDFVVPLHRRSHTVAEDPGTFSVIPRGIHQPVVDARTEIRPSSTAFRELFEELFGGKSAKRNVRYFSPEWYLDTSAPMRWLHEHPDAYTLSCTCRGINLIEGNYLFGLLLVVHDEEFWARFGRQPEPNEESADEGLYLIGTRDRADWLRLLTRRPWGGEALFALTEGFGQLSSLYPDRCEIPTVRALA